MTEAPPIVVWGVGGHALVIADLIRASERYKLIGFLIDAENSHLARESLRPFLLGGSEKIVPLLAEGVREAVVAIGDCKTRLAVAAQLRSRGCTLTTLIHPSAAVASDAIIGMGTVIAAGAVIGSQAIIGENVIVNTGATVDHECRLADGAHISPGAHLAGRVTVGRATWVGIGAGVIDGITIGANSVIGAGAVVVRDIPDNVIAYGVPARVMKENQDEGEPA